MHRKFRDFVEDLKAVFERLLAATPVNAESSPQSMPKQGVYLFSENGKHFYVGRSNNIRNRYGMHYRQGSTHNQATLAFKLAREMTGKNVAYYTGPETRANLVKIPEFNAAFTKAKERTRKMDFRFVAETDQKRQALLELYCAIVLETPYNDFNTH